MAVAQPQKWSDGRACCNIYGPPLEELGWTRSSLRKCIRPHSTHTLLTQFLSHTTTPTGWALLLSPELLVGFWHHQRYSGVGADIVMESITTHNPVTRGRSEAIAGSPGRGIVFRPWNLSETFAGDDCCGMTGPLNRVRLD